MTSLPRTPKTPTIGKSAATSINQQRPRALAYQRRPNHPAETPRVRGRGGCVTLAVSDHFSAGSASDKTSPVAACGGRTDGHGRVLAVIKVISQPRAPRPDVSSTSNTPSPRGCRRLLIIISLVVSSRNSHRSFHHFSNN